MNEYEDPYVAGGVSVPQVRAPNANFHESSYTQGLLPPKHLLWRASRNQQQQWFATVFSETDNTIKSSSIVDDMSTEIESAESSSINMELASEEANASVTTNEGGRQFHKRPSI